jgi:hypothetical protein
MSVGLAPFRIGPSVSGPGEIPIAISLVRVREALAGRDRSVSASHAVYLLAASDLADKEERLIGVLRNPAIAPDARRRAAIQLAHLNQPDARTALVQALDEADPRVLGGTVKALGWIGRANAYGPVIDVMRRTSGSVAAQAEFAARLIAHRHGLTAPELPPLTQGDQVEPAPLTQTIRVVKAPEARARQCLDAIASRNFSLAFDRGRMYGVFCGRDEWMLLFNERFANDPPSLLRRRSIPAAVALFSPESQTFSLALLVLFEPVGPPGEGTMVACRSTGQAVFAGSVRAAGDAVECSLRALSRPGAYPLQFDTSFRSGALMVHAARSGPVVVPKLTPRRIA